MSTPSFKRRSRIRLRRIKFAAEARGVSVSKYHQEVADGLCTRPVKQGLKISVWPEFEIDEINAARIAGKSDDEIRQLVRALEAARKNLVVGQCYSTPCNDEGE